MLRKVTLVGGPALAVTLIAGLTGFGWYFSGQVIDVNHDPPLYPLRVKAIDGDRVTLPRTDESERPGTWGLAWDGGRVWLGPIVNTTKTSVVRTMESGGNGTIDEVVPRMPVRVETWVYEGDPKTAHGIDYEPVEIPSPVGNLPAWFVPGDGSTWVIGVHGRNATPEETLRILPELERIGMPTLAMSYRNDEGAPAAPDGKHHLGATEWNDVAAAIEYARERGADGVVLYGWSMGGAIVMNTLRNSDQRAFIRGVILDSPVLDWSSLLDEQGTQRGLPGPLTALAKRTVELRTGIHLAELDQRTYAPDLRTPVLLFADLADDTVNVESTLEFARLAGQYVTLVTTKSGHTASWNEDPVAYETQVRRFLESF